MECQFCHNVFSNKQNLNSHQKKARYCLKIQGVEVPKKYECKGCNKTFEISANFERHKKTCKNPNKIQEYKDIIKQMNKDMTKLHETIKVLQKENEMLREDKKDLQESYTELSLTAVKRPVNNTKNIQINNFIQKMEQLRIEDIEESVPMLTLDHHVKGPEGYAEYALEFPFKDKIVCVDVNRNKIKYKDGEGNVIEDVGFQKMMIKLCESLKDRSFNLCQEHYEKLSDQFTEKELDEYNCMNTALAISRYANGRENDFCNKMIKLISKGSTINK
uniref:C2H2-type domain-containing protein n=1 Tax=viral metagenome TaxID=1070528 RepID=A0A6C0JPC6_9ZZZZ